MARGKKQVRGIVRKRFGVRKSNPCGICNREFFSNRLLKMHVAKHVAERDAEEALEEEVVGAQEEALRFPCVLCPVPQAFSKRKTLNEHYAACHTEEYLKKASSCLYCGQKFLESKIEHERMHSREGRLPCSICFKTFINRSSLLKHQKLVHSTVKIFKCITCEAAFKTSTRLMEHTKYVHEKDIHATFQCREPNCLKKFTTRCKLLRHYTTHLELSLRKKWQCEVCGIRFTSTNGLSGHLQTQHSSAERNKCCFCNKLFDSVDALNVHIMEKNHQRPKLYKCTPCKVKFCSKRNLKRHLRRESHQKNKVEMTMQNANVKKVLKKVRSTMQQKKVVGPKKPKNSCAKQGKVKK